MTNKFSAITQVVSLCLAGLFCTPVSADADDYQQLPGHKALAVGSNGQVRISIHSQPTNMAASFQAMQQCEAQVAETAVCELIKISDQDITTAAAIRARVPAAAHPLYLWEYRSEQATVYLAGSVHILKPALYPLPAPYQAAFDAADTLVVEVDTATIDPQELMAARTTAGMLPEGKTLSNILPPDLYLKLSQQATDAGIPMGAIETSKPMLAYNQISISQMFALGYRPDLGMEYHFRQQLGDRDVLSLETMEMQLDLLFNQPLETQVALIADALAETVDTDELIADMMVAWLSGDDLKLHELFQQQSGKSAAAKAFNKRLLDDRNIGMTEQIADYLAGKGTYFVLIGAAHFIGEHGIIAMLEAKGITGTRYQSQPEE